MQTNLRIKNYLVNHGISQSFISEKTGISTSKLNLSLNGKRKFTFEEFGSICEVLKVEPNLFIKLNKSDKV